MSGPTRTASLYVCYADASEPLVDTQVVPYLSSLAAGGIAITLLTFEQRPKSGQERSAIEKKLAGQGIRWRRLPYHKRPSLPATAFDILQGSLFSLFLCLRDRIPLVHARSHVAAAMGLAVKALLGRKLLFDMRGLLADEYVDAGHWRKGTLKYSLTKRLERAFLRQADAVVVLTQAIRSELVRDHPALEARLEVIPCCVDTERFRKAAEPRAAARARHGWGDRFVLAYIGKLGTWYLVDEMARFFAELRSLDPTALFAVFTQSEHEAMHRALAAAGVAAQAYQIGRVAVEAIPAELQAADAAISFVRPSYSKKASSPTKIGEYLAAGVLTVANSGVGDCDELLSLEGAGQLVRALDVDEYRRVARLVLDSPRTEEARATRRALASEHLSLSGVGAPRYRRLYEGLGLAVNAWRREPS